MARSSPGVLRVAAILNFIAEHPGQAFTLSDLVRALKLSRATCHALLTGLVEVGYLYRASDKAYVLGPALVAIGRVAAEHASPLQIAKPEMRALADEFESICSAFFLDKEDVVVRERAASVSHLGNSPPMGARMRLRAPFAAIYYAWSPQAEAEAWLNTTTPPPTPEQRSDMFASMAFARERGYMFSVRNPSLPASEPAEKAFAADRLEFPAAAGVNLDPAQSYRVLSVTAPVFDAPGNVAFVLGLVGFDRMARGDEIEHMGRSLRAACDRVTAFIAGVPH
ncbi:helix-turn-helix domain-containing protein [Phenylobacterium sp. LjRoot219]|uniref:IclR family transcriptional regulator n=1 Tax=Phenylobacterium sp. LjRoot219 TaxID=3342283 RepID=UPI003ECFA55B